MWQDLLPIVWSWRTLAVLSVLVAFAFVARALYENPREEPLAGLAVWAMWLYSKVMHRLRVEGREHLPGRRGHGPVLLVANHTAGVDPVLIQAIAPFEVRFMMARDMQPAAFDWLWEWTGVIAVNRDGPDGKAAREAIRWLKDGGLDGGGGVIGIFPEGGIERPARQILPFLPGLGLMVHRTGARVLPVIIDGVTFSSTAWGSLLTRSRARLRVLPPIDYADSGLSAAEIAADLRRRFLAETGWPANDRPRRELTQA